VIHKSNKTKAFSLVEVVVALAIFIFAGFALIGLLSVALKNSRDSKEQLQAANISEYICATRRATPLTDFTVSANQPGFPLPVLYSPAWAGQNYTTNNFAAPTLLTWDGVTTSSQANARFGMVFNIISATNYVAKVSPGVATVYLSIYWPAQAQPGTSAGHFELTTKFALP
jgi:type II secretory pathway pseudopilin PulG